MTVAAVRVLQILRETGAEVHVEFILSGADGTLLLRLGLVTQGQMRCYNERISAGKESLLEWVKRQWRKPWCWTVLGLGLLCCLGLVLIGWRLLPPLDPTPYQQHSASGQLLDRHGKPLYLALNRDDHWSLPQSGEAFSPYLIQATVAAEDQRFYRHHGVDPVAVVRAAGQNVQEGGVASGASTLTMQLIKLGGKDSGSLMGKLGQALGALRLEKSLDKPAILEAYLNRAPYGMNLQGAEVAAWRYFGKTARTLSLGEAALLAGLPKAPSRLNPLSHPERARIRRDYVLGRMFAEGYIDAAQRDQALAEPVLASWHAFPRLAPHLGSAYRERLEAGERIALRLDGELQQSLEALLPHYLKRFDGAITNGAILVVDVPTGDVRARVGSASFESTPGGGEVDSCLALRSPGSTLKPFLFGYAMTEQQLYPTEVLLDDVLDFGRYAPGNFDGLFNGPVTATEALRYSLNVPAVALLDRVGVANFHGFLRRGGLTSIDRAPSDYGLGLALGNCEVSLEALARLYLSVASLGRQQELHLVEGQKPSSGAPVFALEVARVLYDMLAQPFPEELQRGLQRRRGNEAPVCWKTGTSTGYHDAWTFAFNQHYLVAVWLGNNDGTGVRQLVGAHAALPLAARIFRELPGLDGPAWPSPLSGPTVSLCALSGLPVNEGCVDSQAVVLPEGLWRHRRCTVHRFSPTGLVAAHEIRPTTATDWNLATPTGDRPLVITSPPPGSVYVLSGVDGGDQIPLSTAGEAEGVVHWFLDGKYLGADIRNWALQLGEHRVTAQLANGQQGSATFTVVRPEDVGREP